MPAMIKVVFLIITIISNVKAAFVLRRHEEFSLKQPFQDVHSHFSQYGAIEIHNQVVRFGRREPNQLAALWSKIPCEKPDWQVMAKLKAHGDPQEGGNGFALWYVKDGHGTGPALGAPDRWTGLGIFIDTYDDDHQGNNPAIYGILNDGNMEYRWQHDGEGQYMAGCLRALRNTDMPFGVRVTHMGDNLKVEVTENAESNDHWVICFEKAGVNLPSGYYFGITASTNDRPDEMELYDLSTNLGDAVTKEELEKRQSAQKTPEHHQASSVVTSSIDFEGLSKVLDVSIQKHMSNSLGSLEHRITTMELTIGQISEVLAHMGKSLNDLTEASHGHHGDMHEQQQHGGASGLPHWHEAINELKMRMDQLTAMLASKLNVKGTDSRRVAGSTGLGWKPIAWFAGAQMVLLIIFLGVKSRWDRREKKIL